MNEKEVKVFEDAMWGNYGKETVSSKIYQVYHMEGAWMGDDEGMWYEFNNKNKSEISIEPLYNNIDSNKYGETKHNEEVQVTITANGTLKKEFPLAQVKIDDQFHDLAILENPVELFMNKDHKISIIWNPETIETFRIIKLK